MKSWMCSWCLLASLFATPVVSAERIVTLSPHLTEWVYSLGAENRLVGVSAFSDYPAAATALPVIADYQGVDFTALMALEPDLVLAWGGGNKPQDIARLKSLGLPVYISQPQTLEAIGNEITEVAALLDAQAEGQQLVQQFNLVLGDIRQQYQSLPPVNVFYYMWSQPLMTIGRDAWANQLLLACGATSVFNDSPIDYPQVSVKQVLVRQPDLLISASSQTVESQENFWAPHRSILTAPVITADANALHRFSLRITGAIESLCQGIDHFRHAQQ